MRTNRVLVIEPAQSYERLQGAKEFFVENLDEFLHQQHRAILEDLMRYERECFLNAHPYQRHDGRVDQANGFYQRHLTTRSGTFELQVPRTRSGLFHSQEIYSDFFLTFWILDNDGLRCVAHIINRYF